MDLVRLILTSPNFLPIISIIGTGFLGLLAAFGQAWGKRKENAAPTSKDVVVQSLTVADTQAITHWAETLRESNRLIRDRAEFEREMLYETKRQNDYLEDIKHCLMALNRSQKSR
jgi:hypothetical protein